MLYKKGHVLNSGYSISLQETIVSNDGILHKKKTGGPRRRSLDPVKEDIMQNVSKLFCWVMKHFS